MREKSGEWLGKLGLRDLTKLLSLSWRTRTPSTLVGPSIGEDAAIIDLGSLDLVFHVDPITEAERLAGWLAIHVAANDIAVTGATPRWATLTILLPGGTGFSVVEDIMSDAERAASELGVEIVGGHTEATPGLNKKIVIASMVGVTCRGCSVPTGGARPGDVVVQVKPAGMEGTAIIATDFRELLLERGIGGDVIRRASELASGISVVREALELAGHRLVSSLHDPTEGGLVGGLVEVAIASGASLRVYQDRVLVDESTREISEALGIDPLKLISSGTLIACIPRERLNDAEALLEELGAPYSIIGEVEGGGGGALKLISMEGEQIYREPPMDEIARLWAGMP